MYLIMKKGNNNDSNAIAKDSTLYNQLINVYRDEKDKRKCFESCYKIIEEADYFEIHFLITRLKEFYNDGFDDFSASLPEPISFVNMINYAFNSESLKRKAFLLDILEEARERKRPNNDQL